MDSDGKAAWSRFLLGTGSVREQRAVEREAAQARWLVDLLMPSRLRAAGRVFIRTRDEAARIDDEVADALVFERRRVGDGPADPSLTLWIDRDSGWIVQARVKLGPETEDHLFRFSWAGRNDRDRLPTRIRVTLRDGEQGTERLTLEGTLPASDAIAFDTAPDDGEFMPPR
jgi:hypothetical protein